MASAGGASLSALAPSFSSLRWATAAKFGQGAVYVWSDRAFSRSARCLSTFAAANPKSTSVSRAVRIGRTSGVPISFIARLYWFVKRCRTPGRRCCSRRSSRSISSIRSRAGNCFAEPSRPIARASSPKACCGGGSMARSASADCNRTGERSRRRLMLAHKLIECPIFRGRFPGLQEIVGELLWVRVLGLGMVGADPDVVRIIASLPARKAIVIARAAGRGCGDVRGFAQVDDAVAAQLRAKGGRPTVGVRAPMPGTPRQSHLCRRCEIVPSHVALIP
jgi:hypothetical protein